MTIDEIFGLFQHIVSTNPWLFNDKAYSLCMYFEEVSDNAVKEHQKFVRDKGVRLSRKDRWKKSVKQLHIIVPNQLNKAQGYIAKHGKGVHGSLLFRSIFEILFDMKEFPPVNFYWNHLNYSNTFIKIFNELPSDVIEPNWHLVRKLAFSTVRERDDGTYESIKKDESREQRATIGLDGGVASTVAAKRGNSKSNDGKLNHHSMPPLKGCTPSMHKLFMPATSLMTSSEGRGEWLDEGTDYYIFKDYPAYHQEFAAKCCRDPSNIVPSLRVSAQNQRNILYGHFDTTNGKYPETEAIGGINRCELDFQIRTNWSAKQAQENYIIRTLQDKVIKHIHETYQRFSVDRRHITRDLSTGHTETYLPGFRFVPKKCHTKTDSFYSLYLFYTLALHQHFSLTLPETLSLMMCIMAMPNSAIFFAISSKIIIASYDSHKKPASGFNFGFLVDGVMKTVYKHFLRTEAKHRSTHWERFKDQRPKGCKSKQLKLEAFHHACYHLLKIILRSYRHSNDQSTASMSIYNATLSAVHSLIKGAGGLTGTHVLRICSHIGLLPCWMANMCKLDKGSKTVKWIMRKWPEYADQIQSEPQIFLQSLTYYLQQENPNEHINLATAENIGCKCKRVDTGGDGKYWDIFEPGQHIYEFLKGTIKVHKSNGIDNVPSNKLVTRWIFGNAELLTMAQIADRSKIPTKMTEAMKFEIPKALWDALNNVTYPIDFDGKGMTVLNPNVPELTPRAALLGKKILNKTLAKYNDQN